MIDKPPASNIPCNIVALCGLARDPRSRLETFSHNVSVKIYGLRSVQRIASSMGEVEDVLFHCILSIIAINLGILTTNAVNASEC